MIHSLSLTHFRNFTKKELSFCAGKNIIIGKNGQGKSNILEALSLPVQPLMEIHPNYLLSQEKDVFFVSYMLENGMLAFSYERETQKRKYISQGKSTTKQKFKDSYPYVVSFHPFLMNLLYLGPSERRNFLDAILDQSFPTYKNILQKYKKILSHRNKVLKNISEGKSQVNELDFWNQKFLESASEVYSYRKKIVDFFSQYSSTLEAYFFGKAQKISFEYLSKTDITDPYNSLKSYITAEQKKEILLRKTLRGPHLDDFLLQVDGVALSHFASRGEVKSILLGLKFLETQFIESFGLKKDIIFLVDDLLSELDSEHRDMLWEHIGERQCIITCIEDFDVLGNKIFI